ncbi:phospho-N-acetylmuramoyl-pentapeptide-transferase, partial [Enterococcus faecium]
LVWFINLYNFMDGIDGITGVETIAIAVGTLLVTALAESATDLNGLSFALIGAAAGFLVWNWHKARIFLGDVGSVPLGLMTGTLLVKLAADV